MAHWAAKGVACICIDDSPVRVVNAPVPLKKGARYVIEHVNEHGNLRLEGIGPFGPLEIEYWLVERFRPLVDRDTDIAMFREIADRGLAQNGIHVPSSPELVP